MQSVWGQPRLHTKFRGHSKIHSMTLSRRKKNKGISILEYLRYITVKVDDKFCRVASAMAIWNKVVIFSMWELTHANAYSSSSRVFRLYEHVALYLRFTDLTGKIGFTLSGEAALSSSVTYSKLMMNIIATPSWFFTGIIWVLQIKVEPKGRKKNEC